jgi:hypothetical protein
LLTLDRPGRAAGVERVVGGAGALGAAEQVAVAGIDQPVLIVDDLPHRAAERVVGRLPLAAE